MGQVAEKFAGFFLEFWRGSPMGAVSVGDVQDVVHDFCRSFRERLSQNQKSFEHLPEGARSLQNGPGTPPGDLSTRFRYQRAVLREKNGRPGAQFF